MHGFSSGGGRGGGGGVRAIEVEVCIRRVGFVGSAQNSFFMFCSYYLCSFDTDFATVQMLIIIL
jgi:hypothetical protein